MQDSIYAFRCGEGKSMLNPVYKAGNNFYMELRQRLVWEARWKDISQAIKAPITLCCVRI